MHLAKLSTRNFRLLENFETEFHPLITVLLGANYAGKSSVIDTLLFLRQAAKGDYSSAFSMREGFPRVVSWHDLKRSIEIEAILRDQSGQVSIRACFDSGGLRREQATMDGTPLLLAAPQGENQISYSGAQGQFGTAGSGFGADFLGAHFNHLSLALLHPVRRFFSSIVNVDPFRNVQFRGTVAPKEIIDATGADLPQILHYHYNNDREKYDAYEAKVQKVLPEVDIIETPLVPEGNAATVRIRFRASSVKFELSSLSSGIKDVLVLLAAAHFSPAGSLVLIEEPENHLHAAAQKALCSVLAELAGSQDKQFILTTHSEFILSQFAPAQAVFIERIESGSRAIPLANVDVYSLWQQLGIERSKLLEVLGRTRQIVVITESRNDAKVLEVLVSTNHNLSHKVLAAGAAGGGWAEIIENAAKLRDSLLRFRIPSAVFVLLDNDGEREKKLSCLEAHGFDDGASHIWSEKEVESYLLLPGALEKISSQSPEEVAAVLQHAQGNGKARLEGVTTSLGMARTPLAVILRNALRNGIDQMPPEFQQVLEKLGKLV